MARFHQVRFSEDLEYTWKGGIWDSEEDIIICGCCGGIFEKDDIHDGVFQFKVYDNWVDISEEIMGDENNE